MHLPINNLRRLCKEIVDEDDPETLTRLISELTKHLQHDQDVIKARIAQYNRVSKFDLSRGRIYGLSEAH